MKRSRFRQRRGSERLKRRKAQQYDAKPVIQLHLHHYVGHTSTEPFLREPTMKLLMHIVNLFTARINILKSKQSF